MTLGSFDQEIAVHREIQKGLPLVSVADIRGDRDTVVAETKQGWFRWQSGAWQICDTPPKASAPDLDAEIRQIASGPEIVRRLLQMLVCSNERKKASTSD